MLIALEEERDQISQKIDEVTLRMMVEKNSPTTTIARALKVTTAAVVSRRKTALERARRRQEQEAHAAEAA